MHLMRPHEDGVGARSLRCHLVVLARQVLKALNGDVVQCQNLKHLARIILNEQPMIKEGVALRGRIMKTGKTRRLLLVYSKKQRSHGGQSVKR
jgi:hypothetical protein